MYLLFLSLPGHVTLLDVPLAQEVSEVAEDGEDAVAHVGEHSHQQRGLLKRLHKGLLVQAGVVRDILVLWTNNVKRICNYISQKGYN